MHVCEERCELTLYLAPASDPLRPWKLCCSEPCCCVWVYVVPMFQHSLWLLRLLRGKTAGGSPKHSPLSSLPPRISLPFSLSLCTWRVLVLEETSAPSNIFYFSKCCLLMSWLQAILIILDKQNTQWTTQVNIQMHSETNLYLNNGAKCLHGFFGWSNLLDNNTELKMSYKFRKKCQYKKTPYNCYESCWMWKLHDLGPLYSVCHCKDCKSISHSLVFIRVNIKWHRVYRFGMTIEWVNNGRIITFSDFFQL